MPQRLSSPILENYSDWYVKGSPTIALESERFTLVTNFINLDVGLIKGRGKLVFYVTNGFEYFGRGFYEYSPIPSTATRVTRRVFS